MAFTGGYEGPGRYRHRKGGLYRVLGIARQKRTGERFVTYETLDIAGSTIGDDDFWLRPLEDFNGFVDDVPRFVRVS